MLGEDPRLWTWTVVKISNMEDFQNVNIRKLSMLFDPQLIRIYTLKKKHLMEMVGRFIFYIMLNSYTQKKSTYTCPRLRFFPSRVILKKNCTKFFDFFWWSNE